MSWFGSWFCLVEPALSYASILWTCYRVVIFIASDNDTAVVLVFCRWADFCWAASLQLTWHGTRTCWPVHESPPSSTSPWTKIPSCEPSSSSTLYRWNVSYSLVASFVHAGIRLLDPRWVSGVPGFVSFSECLIGKLPFKESRSWNWGWGSPSLGSLYNHKFLSISK